MRPEFYFDDLHNCFSSGSADERVMSERKAEPIITAEQIPLKAFYSKADLSGIEHMDYAAGIPPFLRGPYASMYIVRPWTIRQYAGFSTAEDSNAFYRRNLAAGRKACRWLLICRRTGDMIPIMNVWQVMWEVPGLPSTRFWI